MAIKATGTSRDLLIHPGETIADILEERGITQVELAALTGVSAAYVSNVINGKKDISAKFAMALEYALRVPKSFWLNLQANYDAELLALNESATITEEEKGIVSILKDIVKYMRKSGLLPVAQKVDDVVLSLRKALQVSNLENLQSLVPCGEFRITDSHPINQFVMGAWLRMCQIAGEKRRVTTRFDSSCVEHLVTELKNIMQNVHVDIQTALRSLFAQYGIDFSVVHNFKGAPVQGYISAKNDGTYQMVLTIRGSFADIFWFSLFHELGHIVNGDVQRQKDFIDTTESTNADKEQAADEFAKNALLSNESYKAFVQQIDFHSYSAISAYAKTQNVPPYIVIGRLQKEEKIPYTWYSKYKLRYKWA